MSEFSWKEKVVAIVPKPFAALSIVGSLYIMRHILVKQERRRATFHRIMLGLSIYDLMASITMFIGTWPIPAGSPGVYMAGGNDATCSAQGFFVQMIVGTPLYNASLSVYYYLVVSLGWDAGQVRKIEPALHLFPVLFSVSTAIAGAATDSYRNSSLWCWIGSSNNAFRLGFYYVPIWVAVALVTLLTAVMYCHVVRIERRMMQFSPTERAMRSLRTLPRKASRKTAAQGLFYVFTFYLAWIFPSWTRVSQMVHGSVPFAPMVLMAIFAPLQGFLNCLVYFRPGFLRYRSMHPELSDFQVILRGITRRFEERPAAVSPSVFERKSNAERQDPPPTGDSVRGGGSDDLSNHSQEVSAYVYQPHGRLEVLDEEEQGSEDDSSSGEEAKSNAEPESNAEQRADSAGPENV